MRFTARLFCVMLLIAPLTAVAQGSSAAMPRVLREFAYGDVRTLFVSASEALSPSGELRADLFPAEEGRMVRDLLKTAPVNGCIPYTEVYYSRVNVPIRMSIDDSISTAEIIVEGVVDGREYGFQFGVPGQLLRLGNLNPIRGQSEIRSSNLYVFVPVGRFNVGTQAICKTDYRYATPPSIGDRVVAFLLPDMLIGQYGDLIDESGLVTVRKNGALSLPARFEGDDLPQTLPALRNRIERPHLEKKEE
jgi:hypothetical protein